MQGNKITIEYCDNNELFVWFFIVIFHSNYEFIKTIYFYLIN